MKEQGLSRQHQILLDSEALTCRYVRRGSKFHRRSRFYLPLRSRRNASGWDPTFSQRAVTLLQRIPDLSAPDRLVQIPCLMTNSAVCFASLWWSARREVPDSPIFPCESTKLRSTAPGSSWPALDAPRGRGWYNNAAVSTAAKHHDDGSSKKTFGATRSLIATRAQVLGFIFRIIASEITTSPRPANAMAFFLVLFPSQRPRPSPRQ